MDNTIYRNIYAPSAYLARGIENLLISAKNTDPWSISHTLTCWTAKALGLIAFPTVLAAELAAESLFLTKDLIVYSPKKLSAGMERVSKLALGIIFSPLSILATDACSYLFLQREFSKQEVRPFGVEKVFGTRVREAICYPKTIYAVQKLVTEAVENGQKISIIGSGMSQGDQTIPVSQHEKVIHLKKMNKVEFVEGSDDTLIKVEAGATWEEVLLEANKRGKAVLVKQASDVFSVGGSIGIGCHGWQHNLGSIASTVEELEIIDANGEHKVLSRTKNPELFGCMFGTLGYFGVVVSATLRVTDNVELQEKGVPCKIEDFHETYTREIRNNPDKPLLMGRLNINGNPLQELYINTFEATDNKERVITPDFELEAPRGARIERMFLDAMGHLPTRMYKGLVDFYWNREVKIMTEGEEGETRKDSRNAIMHFGIKSFFQLHRSDLYTQWLQEYFVTPENLPSFLKSLGKTLEENDVRLLNASIRPVPKDNVSILPYAEQDRYAIVISFHQLKSDKEIEKTQKWIQKVQSELIESGDKWYQAYMPYATQEEFEKCYGIETVEKMRDLKAKYDPNNVFSNRHTAKYFDKPPVFKSFFRRVFQTTDEMKELFADFLQTIFFQLDEKKVFAMMEEILKDPAKTDQDIYEELLEKIDSTKKPLSIFSKLKALGVVRRGMGKQVAEHLKGFEPSSFQNYLEVFNRRYANAIQKEAGLSFKKTTAVCDDVGVSLLSKIEVGSFIYPYQKSIKLNDDDCTEPALQVEKTYKPLSDEIENSSLDLVAGLGGFHHTPEDRLEPFIQSIHSKLKPGGVLLVRDHNAESQQVTDIAAVVHAFVNAADGWKLEPEMAEIRNFRGNGYWQDLLESQGFTRIDKGSLVLPKDPTQNGMMMFAKTPQTKEEVEAASLYTKNAVRSPIGSYSTWLEWGNVRFSKQYAEFIQNHHDYEFDFAGHLYQHWTHFYHTMKKSLQTPGVNLKDVLFSDNMAMNLFILFGTTAQLGLSALLSLPSKTLAHFGLIDKNAPLSALEKFTAATQKDYSDFIDFDPFYKYPYFATIAKMWKTVFESQDSWVTKLGDAVSAISATVSYGAVGLASAFIDGVYYSSDASSDLETIQVLLDDPHNRIDSVIEKWNTWKNSVESVRGENPYARCEIKVVYAADGRKLLSVPFYKPFTKFVELAGTHPSMKLVKVGGQDKITLDVCLEEGQEIPKLLGSDEAIYEMNRLQDNERKRRYKTCEIAIDRLLSFSRQPGVKNQVEYIHVHR